MQTDIEYDISVSLSQGCCYETTVSGSNQCPALTFESRVVVGWNFLGSALRCFPGFPVIAGGAMPLSQTRYPEPHTAHCYAMVPCVWVLSKATKG